MGRYLLKRLGVALLLVFVVSSAALVLARFAPGDFVAVEGASLTEDQRAALRHDLGLDRSFASQYISWMAGAMRLDFGQSLLYSRPVSTLIGERALNTAVLATAALLIATVIGIPLGIYSGTRSGMSRAVVKTVTTVGVSVPPLIGSLVLVFIAARTGWFPVGGMSSPIGIEMTWAQWLADLARHLPMPALALAIPLAATLEKLQSESIEASTLEPFVAASRARGVSTLRAILRHAWPASLRPVLGLYGLMIGSLFSGSFV
ncbi:MAG TPA: ABC transporter permease, partial [Vicinamibacterales bacterium]|nr:ABC transporter permease [Vicinamibacterales bacterium]